MKLSDKIGQFATVPHTFIETRGLSTSARWLFVVLRYYTNGKTEVAFPSIQTLADTAGMKRHTVVRAIRELIAAGWLSRLKRYGKTAIYSIEIPSSAQNGTSAEMGTVSSAKRDTISSAEMGTVTRTRQLDRDELDREGERATRAAAQEQAAPTFSATESDPAARTPGRRVRGFGEVLTTHDDPRVAAYLEIVRGEITPSNAEIIVKRVSMDAIEEWRTTLTTWASNEWKATNFAGMLERYDTAVNGKRIRAKAESAKNQHRQGDKFDAALQLIRSREEVAA